MDLSNAVVNHNHNHSNSNSNGNGNGYIGMDEDEEADPNVAIAEQVNHLEAILQPTIDLLEQMKYVFDRIKRKFYALLYPKLMIINRLDAFGWTTKLCVFLLQKVF